MDVSRFRRNFDRFFSDLRERLAAPGCAASSNANMAVILRNRSTVVLFLVLLACFMLLRTLWIPDYGLGEDAESAHSARYSSLWGLLSSSCAPPHCKRNCELRFVQPPAPVGGDCDSCTPFSSGLFIPKCL